MRILLVEDDSHKREEVVAFILKLQLDCIVETANSIQTGIDAVRRSAADLVLLDMSLPVFDYSVTEDGFKHVSFGGRDFLDFLERATIQTKVIVLTAFDRFSEGADAVTLEKLSEELCREFPDHYVGSIWYSTLHDDWKARLAELLTRFSAA